MKKSVFALFIILFSITSCYDESVEPSVNEVNAPEDSGFAHDETDPTENGPD